eukprot:1683192-Pyramimonas_sp.AAC.1
MLSPIYKHFLTTGEWKIELKERSIILRRGVRRPANYTEQDLKDNNYEVSSNDIGESLELDDDKISQLEFLSCYEKENDNDDWNQDGYHTQ